MGKSNKARRAAKAKSRARARSSYARDGREGAAFTQAQHVRAALIDAFTAMHRGQHRLSERLAALQQLPTPLVDAHVEALLLEHVRSAWTGGWQPFELHRQGRLGATTSAGAQLVALAIAADHHGRRSTTLDARWRAQVDALGLPAVDGRPGWVGRWAMESGLDRLAAITTAVASLANLGYLPRLDPILPPPGSSGQATHGAGAHAAAVHGGETNPILVRIRALLAKAESTTFEAEALAFTAKAQELMTRHAIDSALLAGGGASGRAGDTGEPIAIRVPIDAPYADAKSFLLQLVADASRCRAVFMPYVALSTVVGFPDDVAAVEMLFTSLLVQAQTALAEAARHARAGTRTRSQSYRSAFLLAYANRIGERLREINEAIVSTAKAEHGASFLPVLRSRAAAIDDFMTAKFADMTTGPVRGGYDRAGWVGGRLAADSARLNAADLASAAGCADEIPAVAS